MTSVPCRRPVGMGYRAEAIGRRCGCRHRHVIEAESALIELILTVVPAWVVKVWPACHVLFAFVYPAKSRVLGAITTELTRPVVGQVRLHDLDAAVAANGC